MRHQHDRAELFLDTLPEEDDHQLMELRDADVLASYHQLSVRGNLDRSTNSAPDSEPDSSEHKNEGAICGTPTTVLSEAFDKQRPHMRETGRVQRRRQSEAIQFFQAVGESVPTNEIVLQTLIDDNDENEDRYSDGEDECVHSTGTDRSIDIIEPMSVAPDIPPPSFGQTLQKRLSRVSSFFHRLPWEVRTQDFTYKGIKANPPEITTRGIDRGNYAQLHRKAWLEVSDKKHRYGKNLRLYYRQWESLGFPTESFFDWLDSKGEAEGWPLPNLDECPRSILDSDTVRYITDENETKSFMLSISSDAQGRGLVLDVDGNRVRTGEQGWIFVLRDGALYGAAKSTSFDGQEKQRFHHSSFFGGKAVSAAGIFVTDDDGHLTLVFPHSGHYRPGESDMQRVLFYIYHNGVDMRTFEVDIQQLIHIDRTDGSKEKRKKRDSLYLRPATVVAHYLSHKARFIEKGIFDQIHKLRDLEGIGVRQALAAID